MIAVLSIMTVVVHTFLVWRQLRMHIIVRTIKQPLKNSMEALIVFCLS